MASARFIDIDAPLPLARHCAASATAGARAAGGAGVARRVRVRHHQAVWETATFEAEMPEDVEDAQAWVEEHFEEIFARLTPADLDVEVGDAVDGIDSEIEVEAL